MFTELSFFDPAMAITNPRQARGWAATALNLPPVFFNRDVSGAMLHTISPFVISSDGKGGVRLIAYGSAATQTLYSIIGAITESFRAAYPKGGMQSRAGEFAIETSPRLQGFVARDFVIEKAGSRVCQEFLAKDPAHDFSEHAASMFRDHLARRLHAATGAELPEDCMLGEFKAQLRERPVSRCASGLLVSPTVNLFFRGNIILKGPWFVGPLAGKGCGRLTPSKYLPAI